MFYATSAAFINKNQSSAMQLPNLSHLIKHVNYASGASFTDSQRATADRATQNNEGRRAN